MSATPRFRRRSLPNVGRSARVSARALKATKWSAGVGSRAWYDGTRPQRIVSTTTDEPPGSPAPARRTTGSVEPGWALYRGSCASRATQASCGRGRGGGGEATRQNLGVTASDDDALRRDLRGRAGGVDARRGSRGGRRDARRAPFRRRTPPRAPRASRARDRTSTSARGRSGARRAHRSAPSRDLASGGVLIPSEVNNRSAARVRLQRTMFCITPVRERSSLLTPPASPLTFAR